MLGGVGTVVEVKEAILVKRKPILEREYESICSLLL
jgi:hypothetical protein